MFSLIQMLGRAAPKIDVIDVGAMWLGPEHVTYRALVTAGLARVVGFEPVKAECDRLNAMAMKDQRYLPYFIGDGTRRRFFEGTEYPMNSSLYRPNMALLSKFQNLAELMEHREGVDVETKRLDDLTEIEDVDFLKADVQGAELDVFRGAERRLSQALVLETEAEFLPLYEGQPLFADVDSFLRARGFVFHTFAGLTGRCFKPVVARNDVNAMIRQLLWSNAVYVKDFLRFDALPAQKLLKLAVILHEVYGSADLASLALEAHDAQTKAGLHPIYMQRLTGGK